MNKTKITKITLSLTPLPEDGNTVEIEVVVTDGTGIPVSRRYCGAVDKRWLLEDLTADTFVNYIVGQELRRFLNADDDGE